LIDLCELKSMKKIIIFVMLSIGFSIFIVPAVDAITIMAVFIICFLCIILLDFLRQKMRSGRLSDK